MLNDFVLVLCRRFGVLMTGVGLLLAAIIAMIYSEGGQFLWKILPPVVFGFTAFGIGIDNYASSRRRRLILAVTIGLALSFIATALEMFGEHAAFSVGAFLRNFIGFGFFIFMPDEVFERRA